jgi:hypothetical protein
MATHDPKGELRRFEPVPDDVVLAATGRAERNRDSIASNRTAYARLDATGATPDAGSLLGLREG